MNSFFKKVLRYISIDVVSTIFLGIMLTGTVVSLNNGYSIEGGLLAMCDLFILRGIIWQGGYYDLIQELMAQVKVLEARLETKKK